MTSEIRANTIKNRVGLGTVSFTNTGPVVSGIVTATSIEVVGAINDDAARIKIPDGMNGAPYTGNLELGNSRDFVMLHDGHHNYVKSTQNMYVFCGGNNLVTLQTGGSVLLNKDLDVDGHTNLDNVSIAGVTTGTTINATTFVGNLTGNVTGNANTATTTERVTLTNQGGDSTCNVLFAQSATGNQLPHTNANLTFNATNGRLTATSFAGDGSNLTGITQTTINSNTNNYLITGTGTANTLQGESNLTFSGSTLKVNSTTGHSFLKLNSNDSYSGSIYFGDQSDEDAAQIWYDNYQGNGMYLRTSENTPISFFTNGTERAVITSGGEFQIQHFSPPDGSSASRAARSALEIKRHYPQKTSGNYWIKDNNGTARQIYCEMETDGGGWMLWHDHNAPGSKVSMNIALGGSDASPSGNLARSNYNNYAYYSVWIKASQINATGERLHSFVTLDGDGEIKYVADYGADFLYEDVGDQYQPNLNAYFNSPSSSEYVSNTQMYQPQCGASGWQSFSNGGWQEVYIREMDTRMNPGDHRGLHLVERIYGFDSAGVPRWSVAESNQPLPYWSDVCLRAGESANGAQDMLSFGNRRIQANAGNNGPSIQGRSKGILTGTFEYEFSLGYSWGWSIGALVSTIQIENSIKSGVTAEVYNHYSNIYFFASLYNNSSNNQWYVTTRPAWQNSDSSQTYTPGASSGSNVMWRETDGTIKVKAKGANVSHTHTFPHKFAGPLILCSGNQSPHSTYLYDVWNDDKNDNALGGRNRWYK